MSRHIIKLCQHSTISVIHFVCCSLFFIYLFIYLLFSRCSIVKREVFAAAVAATILNPPSHMHMLDAIVQRCRRHQYLSSPTLSFHFFFLISNLEVVSIRHCSLIERALN